MPQIHYSSEMGLTHSDFFRLLPKAMGDHPYTITGNVVNADVHDGKLTIDLGPPLIRKIALLEIPYSVVSFTFNGVTEVQQQAFKQHFDLHFQRGGG
ncbi:MAG: hypothetical protein KTR35_12395 [Gammaproteobacteria bacterium]|nr:hypothetical protein [Gammaproteobacteria bacterium]